MKLCINAANMRGELDALREELKCPREMISQMTTPTPTLRPREPIYPTLGPSCVGATTATPPPIQDVQAHFPQFRKSGESVVDEFIAERKEEAKKE